MSVRRLVVENVIKISYHLRLPRICDFVRGRHTKILMYHGIPAQSNFPGITNYYGYNVPVDEFEQQIKYLKSNCNIVSLSNFLAGRGLSGTKMNIVITFDDGYENNYANAFRVLEHYRIPAVYALPTSFVFSGKPLWNDIIEYAVNRSPKRKVDFSNNGTVRKFDLHNSADRLGLYSWLMRQCVIDDQKKRNDFIDSALEVLEVESNTPSMFENDDYRPLRKEQILEMSGSGYAEFASHSVNHFLLAKLDRANKHLELQESKRQIEELTGTPCVTFCVPGGSYDDEMLEEASELGYNCVLTSDTGYADSQGRTLNRNGVFRTTNIQRFADWIHGPASTISSLLRKLRK